MASAKKFHNRQLRTAMALLLCVAVSSALVFSYLTAYTQPDDRLYIPLTRSSGLTTVTVGEKHGDSVTSYYSPANHRLLTARPGFRVTDEKTVWTGSTSVDIFYVSYQNGAGQITVNSQNGDKVIAPGTDNTYRFALENTGNVPLAYTMEMEAYFSHEDYRIPVVARLCDHTGKYLVGTAEEMGDVLALNGVSEEGSLAVGYIQPYTLEWQWPFEVDDTYDTMLGNLAVDEDISLTIVIKTTASYTEKPTGGLPQTGDSARIGLWFTMMLGSAAGILILLLLMMRQCEEERYEKA